MASGTLEWSSLHEWILFSLYRADGRQRVWRHGVSGLLMSTLWIEWPRVVVGLWYGQAYVIDNEHRCILLMAFWMHRDIVMRSWGPLLCHSSMTITSCCSMIMHGPCCKDLFTIPGSWKHPSSCMASILTGHVTHWACLGCSGSVYMTACSGSWQYQATSQPLKRSGPTSHRPHSTTWSTLCEGDVLHCVRQMVITPDTDWFSDPPQYSKTAHFRVVFYCGQPKAHLCNTHVV